MAGLSRPCTSYVPGKKRDVRDICAKTRFALKPGHDGQCSFALQQRSPRTPANGQWPLPAIVCIGAAGIQGREQRSRASKENAGGNMRKFILAAASVAALVLVG